MTITGSDTALNENKVKDAFIKLKITMNKKSSQTFLPKYTTLYPSIVKSYISDQHARCKVCNSDFKIGHGGINDCKKHVDSVKHRTNCQLHKQQSSLNHFITDSNNNDIEVTRAECLMTSFIIEHNLPLSISDHFTVLTSKMFPDSELAKRYSCKRTKTTSIIHSISDGKKEEIIDVLRDKTNFYSISTDGSADRGDQQLYPVIVKYYDKGLGRIVTHLLSLPKMLEISSTGKNIFDLLDSALKNHQMSWDNCNSFSSDNASVMLGNKSGVASYILKENSNIVVIGCSCHLVHLAASKASKTLLDVSDILVSIYYYLDKSSQRHKKLQEIQQSFGVEGHVILKHCPTRWLSLSSCIKRLLEQWDAVIAFFEAEHEEHKPKASKSQNAKGNSVITCVESNSNNNNAKVTKKKKSVSVKKSKNEEQKSESKQNTSKSLKLKRAVDCKVDECDAIPAKSQKKDLNDKASTQSMTKNSKSENVHKATRIYNSLINPETKLTLLFLDANISVFDNFNTLLQKNEPCIQILHSKIIELLTELYIKFVKPDAIRSAATLFEVKYKERSNQKDRDLLFIGTATRNYLNECKENSSMNSKDRTSFFDSVRAYYAAALDYILSKFPIHDKTLQHAEVADISKKDEARLDSVKFFAEKFKMKDDQDNIETEFNRYQVDDLPDNILKCDRIDTAWHMIGQIKVPGSQSHKYSLLSKLMLNILVIPHSNADAERLFSGVRKNQTEFRSSLSVKTLESMLVVKNDMCVSGTPCYGKKFSNAELQRAKKATHHYQNVAAQAKRDAEVGPPSLESMDISGQIMSLLDPASNT